MMINNQQNMRLSAHANQKFFLKNKLKFQIQYLNTNLLLLKHPRSLCNNITTFSSVCSKN